MPARRNVGVLGRSRPARRCRTADTERSSLGLELDASEPSLLATDRVARSGEGIGRCTADRNSATPAVDCDARLIEAVEPVLSSNHVASLTDIVEFPPPMVAAGMNWRDQTCWQSNSTAAFPELDHHGRIEIACREFGTVSIGITALLVVPGVPVASCQRWLAAFAKTHKTYIEPRLAARLRGERHGARADRNWLW